MKRILIAVLVLVLILSGCNLTRQDSKNYFSSCGIWLSYYEVADMLNSSNGLSNELNSIIENCINTGIEDIYVHVRSHCDSIFPSEFFPLSEEAKIYDYDVFEYMITEFHKNSIKVHAWINPYRVKTATSDINDLSSDSPAYKWLTDETNENDTNVCISDGIYLNPASSEVQCLIINGIREIVSNYDVDGIAFDDYFYPTTSEDFDKLSYQKYKESAKKPLSLGDWRRTNVNMLISGCYNAIKAQNGDIIFTVSPSHSVDRNYSEFYADAKYWVKNGIVDVIMPQLYFGFRYPDEQYRFENLLQSWKETVKEKYGVKLIISLPAYKIGTDSKADYEEWNSDTDIIARQAEICYKDERVDGFVIFSYSSLFSENELNTKQRNNLIETVKSFKLSKNSNG